MRKSIKISLIVVSVLVFGLLVLYVFRNDIADFALRKIVSSKSGSKITLTLQKVDFNPLHGSLSIYRPSLSFTDVYLDQKMNMEVSHLSFEKLGVYNVSVLDLLMDNRFVADKVLVLKPSVHFEKHNVEETGARHFSPDKLLGLLNTNSKTFTSLKFNINEVEIRYGSFNLQMDTLTEYAPDSLDFTILLKGFVTQDETKVPVAKRILFSDEVIFRIKNLSKRLDSGYDLHIDSVSYNSRLERVTSDGLSLVPLPQADEKKNKSSVSVAQIKVDGLGVAEIRGKEKLHLSAIAVSGVTLSNYSKEKKGRQQTTAVPDTTHLKKLPQIFDGFLLDSLMVNRFSFFNLPGENDTTLAAENIGLFVKDIAFGSSLLNNPLQHLQMGEVILSSDKLKLLETEKGITVTYSNFSYSSESKQLYLNEVQVFSDSLVFRGAQFKLELHALQLSGFSVHDFLRKKEQILSLKLNRPVVQIDLQQQAFEKKSATKKKNEYLELLTLQNFSIADGLVNLSDAGNFNVDLKGINLEANGFEFIGSDSARQLKFDNLSIGLEGIVAELTGGNDKIKTGAVLFDNRDFEVSALQADFSRIVDNQKMKGSLSLRKLQVSDIDLNGLLFGSRFNAGSIVLDAPALSGNFPLPDSAKTNNSGNDQNAVNLPPGFQIGELRLQHGKLDVSLEKTTDTIRVQANVDLQLGAITSSDSSFISWLAPSDWEIELSEIDMSSATYDLCANRVKINPRQSFFELNQLSLLSKPHPKHEQSRFEIEKITLPEITVSGLDYDLLIGQDSIRFSKLSIENPDLNIKLFHPGTGKNSENRSTKWNTESLLNIVYDTIVLKGLHLNLEKSSDSSHTLVGLHNLSIGHLPGRLDDLNLLHEIAFQLDELSIRDTVANTILNLREIIFEPELTALTIRGVNWLKTANGLNANKETLEADIAVRSSKIVFSGAYLKEGLPSSLKFNKLRFSDVDVTVTGGSERESAQKKELDFNLKALKKYSGLLSRLAIDTTIFDDVSVHYTTFDGSQEHTIRADSIGLVVNRVDIDTNMLEQENPILINNIIIDLKGRTRISNDSLYEIQTGRIHYNFPEHRITVDSFYVLPRYEEAECFRRAKYQKGILNLFGRKVELNDLRLDKLLNDKELHFGGIDIFELKVNIVKDKKYPVEPGTFKKMPQDMIRDIAQQFRVDSVRVFDSYIYFKLYPEKKTNKPGEIMLTNLSATAYDFTNIISREATTTLNLLLSADIQGESRMDADFHFPLYDTANHWWFGFKTGKIDFVKLNSMTQNLVGLTILKGKGSVEASLIRGDNFKTTGTMVFRYRKMKLSLYNRKKAETETGIFSSMANFLINDLVLKSNNPKFARKPRTGQVYAERDTQKTIVNFAFKGILSGMLSTLGINKKEQRKERKEYKKEEKQK